MKKKILGLFAILVLICGFVFAYTTFKPETATGSKSITITVVNSKKEEKVYNHKTDALYLKEVMDEIDDLTYSGTDGQYGLMVEIVNGESAVYDKDKAYWSFYVNKEYCNYGIAEQPVNDNDAFEIVYTKAE